MESEKANAANDLRARLALVGARYSQSEIARRTGMPVASVHRYLRHTRVPAGFCTALVTGLGVNPSWLLTGEGAPWLSDVRGETGRMAGDLLELVGAMNAVARMRLGSLVGKTQMKMLRELSDALVTYEQLRERLNAQSRPILRQVLKDWREALFKHNSHEAEALGKAARQVSRLCDDDELARDFLSVSAHHELSLGRMESAISLQRRALLAALTSGEFPTEASFAEARRFCVELNHAARLKEASRYTRAFLTLARARAKRWPSFANFEAFYGFLLISEGRPERGLAIIKRVLPRLEGPPRESARNSLMLGLFLTGAVDFNTARTMGDTYVHAEVLQAMAIWLCTPDSLAAANAAHEKATRGQVLGERYETVLCEALLRALEGEVEAALKLYRDHSHMPQPNPDANPLSHATMAIDYCQLLRICGRQAEARKALHEAERLARAIPVEFTLGLLQRASHHRNARELLKEAKGKAEKRMLRRAARFFARQARLGRALL